jgi:citrate lyase beta subunit
LEFDGGEDTLLVITANPRQPVHTMYGGANLFTPGVCSKLGRLALRSLDANGPFPGVDPVVMSRVREKLSTEPIEDYRIDFEDGYGERSGPEEDHHAEVSATALATAMRDNLVPPFIGIRIKPLNEEQGARALRTLDIFLRTLLQQSGGGLPANFLVTLPKIEGPAEPALLVREFISLEVRLGLAAGSLKFEFLVETPQALLALPQILSAAKGRATGAHFGAYDYLAAIDIAATRQDLLHPSCDFARSMMKACLANRGIFLADGVTNLMPIGTPEEVRRGWDLHYRHVRHSLESGFYQGWDVHPAQLVSRYAAVYSFFREGWEEVATRLRNFRATSEQATLTGSVFDDLASVRGLVVFLDRAVQCGALTTQELEAYS